MNVDPAILLSLTFLFGIAAQFRAANGEAMLHRLLSKLEGRLGVLLATILLTSLFSPFILNDVLVLVLTPVVISYSRRNSAALAPLIVGEITFTNLSSTLTPFGNPQNLLLWQSSGVSALSFVEGTWLPLVLSGAIALALLVPFGFGAKEKDTTEEQPVSLVPVLYLVLVAATVFGLDLAGVPTVESLGAVFLFGFGMNRRAIREVAAGFDLRSLAMLCLLVAATALVATAIQPLIQSDVTRAASGEQPFSGLFMGFVSSLVSNVPATQLVLSVATVSPMVAPRIAVEAGLAGSIDPIGSFANILALLMVKRSGLPIGKIVALQLLVGAAAFLPALLV